MSDTVTIFDSANTAQLPFGSVTLGGTDYVTASRTFTGSTMADERLHDHRSHSERRAAATTTEGTTGNMVWTPSTTPTDLAGNACAATIANESGAADMEF